MNLRGRGIDRFVRCAGRVVGLCFRGLVRLAAEGPKQLVRPLVDSDCLDCAPLTRTASSTLYAPLRTLSCWQCLGDTAE